MKGTLVNVLAILGGSAIGLLFGRLIPERVRRIAMTAIGLAVIAQGLQMAIDPRVDATKFAYHGTLPYHPNMLVVIGGLVIGGIIGELLQIEKRLEDFGHWIKEMVERIPALAPKTVAEPDAGGHNLVEGFVTASLLYCVGAMAVLGAIADGAGDPSILYVKALLDGIASIVLATTMGVGVALSVLPLFLYQGAISLASGLIAPYLTLPVISTLTATGGLLIAAIGLDLTGIKRLPIGNLLPGVFVAAILAYFLG
jgi:uncharacterized membrane protein YqgA involved in biofilm formation